jgi:Na+-transporting NADH:ubiquinone oxidoreductase subunit NqrF
LEVDPKLSVLWESWVKRISWLWKNIKYDIFKIKKFRCASISKKSKDSWLRIIYTYIKEENKIEFQSIEFIEIYHKNQKTNHNIERIQKYYSD